MQLMQRALLITASLISIAGVPQAASAMEPPAGHPVSREPSWTYGVIRVGDDRDAIKSMPITDRPYRPLHFYGNTVRRMYYRGTPMPAPRDVLGAGAATILRK
jgi:hypothetical protein